MAKSSRAVERILKEIDLIEYMRNCGYTPYPMGNGRYYGLKEYNSVRIYPDTNTYFHPGSGNGDPRRLNVINFAEWHFGISNNEAINMLVKGLRDKPEYLTSKVKRETPTVEKQEFVLPEKTTGNYKHIYAYLIKTRCISKTVITDMIKRGYLYEDIRGNSTFVGFNNDDKACFCFQRGSSDKIPEGHNRAFTKIITGSDFDFAWSVCNNSNKLFVTEACIDSMSAMTLFELHNRNPNDCDYLATCGPSLRPLVNYLDNHPNINRIYLGFDNDAVGDKYRLRAAQILKDKGYKGDIVNKPPLTKDFNEDLKAVSQHNGVISPENNISKTINIERTIQL